MQNKIQLLFSKFMLFVVCIVGLSLALVYIPANTIHEYKPNSGKIGATKPIGGESVDANMTAKEMFDLGLAKYYSSPYAACVMDSLVETQTVAKLSVSVSSVKIKDGNIIFFRNIGVPAGSSGFLDVLSPKKYDETLVQADGSFKYRSAEQKNIHVGPDAISVSKWNTPVVYETREEYLQQVLNDPIMMFMYDVSFIDEEKCSSPVQNGIGQYEFTLHFKLPDATKEYGEIVRKTTATSIPGGKDDQTTIEFTDLSMKVTLWDNGFIRSIELHERYDLKAMSSLGSLSGYADTNSTYYFSYYQFELPIDSYKF